MLALWQPAALSTALLDERGQPEPLRPLLFVADRIAVSSGPEPLVGDEVDRFTDGVSRTITAHGHHHAWVHASRWVNPVTVAGVTVSAACAAAYVLPIRRRNRIEHALRWKPSHPIASSVSALPRLSGRVASCSHCFYVRRRREVTGDDGKRIREVSLKVQGTPTVVAFEPLAQHIGLGQAIKNIFERGVCTPFKRTVVCALTSRRAVRINRGPSISKVVYASVRPVAEFQIRWADEAVDCSFSDCAIISVAVPDIKYFRGCTRH